MVANYTLLLRETAPIARPLLEAVRERRPGYDVEFKFGEALAALNQVSTVQCSAVNQLSAVQCSTVNQVSAVRDGQATAAIPCPA